MFFLLGDPLTQLPGIGPKIALKFAKLGVKSIGDLVHYYPRRWEDFSQITPIAKAQEGQKLTIKATLLTLSQFRLAGRHLHITNALFSDPSGSLPVVWFNQPYLTKTIKKGENYFLGGTVRQSRNRLALTNPSIEPAERVPLHTGRVLAIYPTTEGLTSKLIRRSLRHLITTIRAIPETLPKHICREYKLAPLNRALEDIHFPSSPAALPPARWRLEFEELLPIQLGIQLSKLHWEREDGTAVTVGPDWMERFTNQLDFSLTNSQQRALTEILSDLTRDRPMRRLLLGDVGSGKTIIAAGAILAAIESGYQTALMAPTEVLANQHYRNLQPLLKKSGATTALMTGSAKLISADEIAAGKVDLTIGTQALIQKGVSFRNLNLVIIDEQHRFGVRQRQKLKNKTRLGTPHFLSLSATPIPRTFFLGLMNNLDISRLTDQPQRRSPVITRLATANNLPKIQALIHREIDEHHAVFVITPLIEADDTAGSSGRASVHSEAVQLAKMFPLARIGILHGRLDSPQKIKVMDQLRAKKLDLVVATSVIEVGIDIPHATVIWIKNADRFGLAQLHQLRGRVGRSNLQSYCLVETNVDDPDGLDRLKSFVSINDGTRLAEIDLRLRGPGAFFSEEQSGFLKLKLADLTNAKLIKTTRSAALAILGKDPNLQHYPALKHRIPATYLTHEE
ncbi:hypothetical protein A2V68_01220 [candidate division Kazan bacterium RBG_13_50_9]|uniref:Probable DNA 3'-5' helicase RecG n=1 Tax=candidate division Kazan bacterium RBG_13_50_9 TaxID=1798535 RepID=A0A1F4NSV5_UNCK3|nr:MAG: hypothetical protein A2V68_01220 [candidate division Kazan bacterium RBG_13_50_9]